MKLGKTLRALTVGAALLTAAPSAQAEQKMTDDQRACVTRVLKDSASTGADVKACVAEAGSDDPNKAKKELAPDSLEAQALYATLEARFQQESPVRPAVVKFADVKRALEARPDLLFSLSQMEKTGGQPDVVGVEGDTYIFADVSAESPEGRRKLDYDQAKAMAEKAGYEMMSPEVYRELQKKVRLDAKTWSWLLTDPEMRATGVALYGGRVGDYVRVRRYFADYRVPDDGFRGLLRVPKS